LFDADVVLRTQIKQRRMVGCDEGLNEFEKYTRSSFEGTVIILNRRRKFTSSGVAGIMAEIRT
jgi:hypothetical protein